MAKFLQKPGSGGAFSDAEPSLTLKAGETGEVLLQGGGTPQAPRAELKMATTIRVTVREEKGASLAPDTRLFTITPLEPGSIVFSAAAAASASGEDAAKLRVVALPRSESSLAPEHLILFSGHVAKGDDIQEAYNKMRSNAPNATVYDIPSFARFVQVLEHYRDAGRRIHKLEWLSHGSAGRISISETDWLDNGPTRMQWLRGKGFENVFTAGARTFFHGCNVADGGAGPELLASWGRVFNVKNGGTVAASTSLGFTLGHAPWNGKTYHLWGNTVRFHFAAGGRITDVEGVPAEVKQRYVTG